MSNDIDNMRIRQSEFTQYQRCPRKHHFAYTHNVVPIVEATQRREPASGQRDAGSAFHAGAEALHLGHTLNAACEAATKYVDETRAIRLVGEPPPLTKADDKGWWEVVRLAHAMVAGYSYWLEDTGFDAGSETLEVELPWGAENPNTGGAVAYGMIDLLGRDAIRGGLVTDDVKSVSNFSQTPMPTDFQLRTYCWGVWKTYGEVPVGAGHRMAKRVLRTGTAKPPFFMYAPIHIDQMILEKHEQVLTHRALAILEARSYGLDAEHPALYPNPTKDCSWDCDFKSLCPMVDEGDDWQDVMALNFIEKSEKE